MRVIYFLYCWLVFVPLMAIATVTAGLLCALLIPFLPAAQVANLTAVPWSRLGLILSGVDTRFDGREHIQPGQSYVIVANHLSQFDIWVLYGYLGVDFRWVMKHQLRKVPVIGICCEWLGHIFINREDPEQAIASLNEARGRLVNGTSVLFFPEGTRSRDGQLKPFKKGAFKMAQDLQLPVLPLTITGTHEILPAGSLSLRPGSVQVTVHAPLPAIGNSDAELLALKERCQTLIAAPLGSGYPEPLV
ncbi:1-acyl-sn-glycerol-3-phosphate acyltransferase [Alcanivorax hongdengensis A-11-3]|uniref:1-acyl-sn-glycerol-3-phosphate acyltransferase n=1 Tax=Alcanivorax hongdengensis A-11-3 TaxID=1177179 RepID=L0WG92_9GAMM|nr:lysophospholipid acyltransferase family protein [Alcanivorax hongdengensis]EKF75734.1 1-acyl-sn-glycerol-3-phosphate acyltransferase [Alcanivorax hongdengensis A-11-3]